MTLENTATAGIQKVAFYQRLAKSVDHFVGVNKMIPPSANSDHFVGVSKMVLVGHSERLAGISNEVRELDVRIAGNVVELLEA